MTKRKTTLFVTLGAPGSGKSYFATRFCKEYGFAHIRSDEIRKYVFPKPTYTAKENARLFTLMDFFVEKFLAAGVNVLYDANFTIKAVRKRISLIAKKHNAHFAILWVQTPLQVAIKRAKSRSYHPVDEEVVRGLHNELELPKGEQVVLIDGTKPYNTQKRPVLLWTGRLSIRDKK